MSLGWFIITAEGHIHSLERDTTEFCILIVINKSITRRNIGSRFFSSTSLARICKYIFCDLLNAIYFCMAFEFLCHSIIFFPRNKVYDLLHMGVKWKKVGKRCSIATECRTTWDRWWKSENKTGLGGHWEDQRWLEYKQTFKSPPTETWTEDLNQQFTDKMTTESTRGIDKWAESTHTLGL